MENETKLTDEIKYWFGDGEVDVDLMIKMGVVNEEMILNLWNNRVDEQKKEITS